MTTHFAKDNLQIMSSEGFELTPKSGYEARYRASYRSFLDFHNALTDHRENKKTTQREVAKILGSSQPAVSNFEANNSTATLISTLISYAAAVGLEVEFVVKEATYPDLPEA